MCGCFTSSDTEPKTKVVQVDSGKILDKELFSRDVSMNHTEIHVSCKNLINTDIMSKSDPFAVIYTREKYRCFHIIFRLQWKELGRTEVIDDNLDPVFVKYIPVNYLFQEKQQVLYLLMIDES